MATSMTTYSHNTISQVEINGTTYDITDATTRDTVSQLDSRVTALESSVGNVPSSMTPLVNTVSQLENSINNKVNCTQGSNATVSTN